MVGYLVRRIVNYAILTAVASCAAYVLATIGLKPERMFLGRRPPVPQATIELLLNRWGVNPKVPLVERTATWFGNVIFHQSLGIGVDNHPVTAQIATRVPVSLELLLVGTVIGTALGVTLGVWSAIRQYHLADHVITAASSVIIATPVFVVAIVLMILATMLNQALGIRLIAFGGQLSADAPPGLAGYLVSLQAKKAAA